MRNRPILFALPVPAFHFVERHLGGVQDSHALRSAILDRSNIQNAIFLDPQELFLNLNTSGVL